MCVMKMDFEFYLISYLFIYKSFASRYQLVQ